MYAEEAIAMSNSNASMKLMMYVIKPHPFSLYFAGFFGFVFFMVASYDQSYIYVGSYCLRIR